MRAAEECDGEINGINKDKRSEKVKWGGGRGEKKKLQKMRMLGIEVGVIQIRAFSVGVWRLRQAGMMTPL